MIPPMEIIVTWRWRRSLARREVGGGEAAAASAGLDCVTTPPDCSSPSVVYSRIHERGRFNLIRARLILALARAQGLPYIELSMDEDNLPSQKVVLAHGGQLVERFIRPAAFGGAQFFRYRIDLGAKALTRGS
jgi:hypothetical protein